MSVPTDEPLRWRKSTRSAGNGQCVEVASLPHGVAMRDSKDPEGPILRFTTDSWAGFLNSVRTGEFDLSA